MPSAAVRDQQLAAALQRSETLGNLLQRLRESRSRLDAVGPLLSAGLRAGVRAGPLDDQAWVLLADNNAVAAKLRQLLPQLAQTLTAAGWAERVLKVKVLPRA